MGHKTNKARNEKEQNSTGDECKPHGYMENRETIQKIR